MYLLLHHRQPLACSSFRGAALGLCATHYHLAFVQQTESLVPCLRTTINHRVKHIQQAVAHRGTAVRKTTGQKFLETPRD